MIIFYNSKLTDFNIKDRSSVIGRRRSSLQKLHTLQLEAPITKVITLLSNAAADTNSETAAQIDKVRN